MTRVLKRKNPGPGGMFVCSFLLHAAVFVVITRHGLFPVLHSEQPVYYVDVVNLPVADPQAGNPAANAAKAPATAAVPPAPATPAVQPMKLPVNPAPAARVKSLPSPSSRATKADQHETSREFEERLARLERENESRHQSAALDALRKRSSGNGSEQAGMPGATGKEAGSDYSSYVRSRLEDAFRLEDTFRPDKNKIVEIRLTIDRSGRIISKQVERSSGDVMFNEAVNRAIMRAEKDLKRPPGGGAFEGGFVFKPQGVRKN